MSAESQAVGKETAEVSCWCCGRISCEDDLIRLNNHPEVGICTNCVHFLRRRALDHQATVLRHRLRGATESVRGEVMARGWHERPLIGPVLLWINRHLSW